VKVAEQAERNVTQRLQAQQLEVDVPSGSTVLKGILRLPVEANGVVLFAHGSGSGRSSPRNAFVARQLQEAGFASLLMDLLTEIEADDRRLVFDISLLARRLLDCTEFVRSFAETLDLPIGYFGASTGAGAALVATAERPGDVTSVVSRGGRPDLAGEHLGKVKAPTLLIVGGNDPAVIDLNRQALAQLAGVKEMAIVPGATHLFEEPGALEEVSRLAVSWFRKYLTAES
jgi:putative phosphoribosyl transferase